MDELRPENEAAINYQEIPGPSISVEDGIFSNETPHAWVLRIHGLIKGSALMLGLAHHHEGDDLVITGGWEAMLDGFGYSVKGNAPMKVVANSTGTLTTVKNKASRFIPVQYSSTRSRSLVIISRKISTQVLRTA
mgnify:CR=1 FL=1